MRLRSLPYRVAVIIALASCAYGGTALVGPGGGIVMAYEITGRVSSDSPNCFTPIPEASVALFDARGVLLDEARSDSNGRFQVAVRNPDVAEGMMARLEGDDPTVVVILRVAGPMGDEKEHTLKLPRALAAREYPVRFNQRSACME